MISLTGVFKTKNNEEFGYGKVSKNVSNAIEKIETSASIEICLNIPEYEFNIKDSYRVGFTTWESTKIPDHWVYSLNSVDEVWTASRFIAEVYKKYTKKPVYVFNHGLDEEYKTVKRKEKNIKTLLFIGDELRSNENLVVEAYKSMNIEDTYRLIIKRKRPGNVIKHPGIITIESTYTKDQMKELFYISDALIYPTSGEGFGFVGLEAIGTGLPIISTTEWSEYKDLITVPIYAELEDSKWQEIHPGKMYNPSVENIKESIFIWIENYRNLIDVAYENGVNAHKNFSWDKVNLKILDRIRQIEQHIS